MSRCLVLLLALIASVVLLIPATSSATSIPGPNGKIAFTSGRPSTGVPAPNTGDQGSRIYVADYPSGHGGPGDDAAGRGKSAAPPTELVARPHPDRLRRRAAFRRHQLRHLDPGPAGRQPDPVRSRGRKPGPPVLVARRHRDRLRRERRPLDRRASRRARKRSSSRTRQPRKRNGPSGAPTATPSTTTGKRFAPALQSGTSTRQPRHPGRRGADDTRHRRSRRVAALALPRRQNPLLHARPA